jgi:hypothetical protein
MMGAASSQRLVPLTGRAGFDGARATRAEVPVLGGLNFGIGLFSVSGHFVRDRETRGREPIIGTGGRDNRVAATGFSLRF